MIGEHLLGFADKMFNSSAGVIFTKNYGLLPNYTFYSMVLKPKNYKVEYVVERIPNFSLAGWWVTSYAAASADSPIIWAPMAVSALFDLVESFQMQHLDALFTDSGSSVLGDRNGGVIFGTDYNDFLPNVMTKSLASDTLLYVAHSTLLGVLRKAEHAFYLDPAVQSTNCYVQDTTQMCYSNFNDIIHSVINMGAGVITIEKSRSDGKLSSVFRDGVKYGAGIGPGVYDIHSPKIPSTGEIADRINKMLALLDTNILWLIPDCGLKTRKYTEVKPTLQNMVTAAKHDVNGPGDG